MFSNTPKTKTKIVPENAKEQNRISAGTVITGDIMAKGAFRIEGTLKGTLKAGGKVVISKGGKIEGELSCKNADFEGNFIGNILVEDTLTLRAEAIVDGEITTGKLVIEPGATFNATCKMSKTKSLKSDEGRSGKREEKLA